MSLSAILFFSTLTLASYIVTPVGLVWGWIRWRRNPRPSGWSAYCASAGFLLATASTALAIGALLYSTAIGGFPYYDHRLLRIYAFGLCLSLFAFVASLGGVWKPGPLRWFAPVCAAGTAIFWFLTASSE